VILGHPQHGRCFEEIDDAVSALLGVRSSESGVVFNAHNFPPPAGSIVCNLENFEALKNPTAWAPHEVWDFSERNLPLWPGAMNVRRFELGYHPSMKRFDMRPWAERDIDVVFFGAQHPRRSRLFDILRSYKLNVVANAEAYGAERDTLLARSKLALNLQYYERGVYPTIRALHLLTNGVPFLSETAPEMPDWAKLLPHGPYARLAEMAIQIVRNKKPLATSGALEVLRQTPLKIPSGVRTLAVKSKVDLTRPTRPKLAVVVHIYNRFENLKRWIACWERRTHATDFESELVIVQNRDPTLRDFEKFGAFCQLHGVRYIARNGRGFDLGAFQDICRNRLPDFPLYDALLWCADDCLPMRRDFLKPFVETLYAPGVGLACMTISREYTEHVRTTGFCLRRGTAETMRFSIDPILSKNDCYHLEHRGGAHTLHAQILSSGLRSVMVAPVATSPLWDSDYSNRLPRLAEFNQAWIDEPGTSPATPQAISKAPPAPDTPLVLFICPTFDAFPVIVSSLMAQTYTKWRLLLIDDNDQSDPTTRLAGIRTRGIVEATGDPRITYLKRPRSPNGGMWGHPHRRWALVELGAGRIAPEATHLIITNADNYYLPPFLATLVAALKRHPEAVAAFGGAMLHKGSREPKHLQIDCRLERGYIDCGGVLLEKKVACSVKWPSFDHSSDWEYFQEILRKHGGASKWVKAEGLLFVHN
jgi:hypothetical protein